MGLISPQHMQNIQKNQELLKSDSKYKENLKEIENSKTDIDYKRPQLLTKHRLNSEMFTQGPGHSIYDHNNFALELIDAETNEKIPISTIIDNTRLSRSIDNVRTVIMDRNLHRNPLGQWVEDPKDHFNARSCVEALGLYTTTYIRKRLIGADINKDLHEMDNKGIIEDLTFRNYVKGGAQTPREVFTNEPSEKLEDETSDYKRVSGHMGIGLGESAVLNPPFQFNKRDDVHTNPMYTKIGRVYSTQIMNNWPVVLFQPGRLKYNTGFYNLLGLGMGAGSSEALIRTGGEGISGLFAKMATVVSDVFSVVGTIGSAIFGGSKMVEFKQAIKLYDQYVSFLWVDLAGIMGLFDGSKYVGAVKHLSLTHVLPTLHMEGTSGKVGKYLNNQYIPFRTNADIIGSESFSNSTTTNPIMEKLNQQAEENAAENTGGNGFVQDAFAKFKGMLLSAAGNFSEQALVISGRGRASLPDVFSSSSFSRSFNCSLTLHYPYGDTLGKFENEFIQFLAVLAMGLARQTGKMSYTSPFAVRVFVKNQIMINMGMIESISVKRGGSSNDWGPDGFPKTLKVDINVKDMEPNILLPLASRGPFRMALEAMFPATGMSEYLGSIGGLSLDLMTHNFRMKNLKRATTVFRAAWSSAFDLDNMLASVANTNMVANVLGLFKSVELDHYYQIGDVGRVKAEQNAKNTYKNKFAYSGFGYQAIANNGTDKGYATLKEADLIDLKHMKDIESETGKASPYPWN